MDYVYVHVKEANGEVSYNKCINNMIRDPYFHNLALVSNNKHMEDRVSNIDIDSLYFRNFDSSVYQNKADLAAEKLELTAQLKNIQKQEDGTYHPQDLMAHKI